MQAIPFTNLVEQIQQLPFEEKQVLSELLENYLREERRKEIYKTYQETKKNQEQLVFSSDINTLKKQLL